VGNVFKRLCQRLLGRSEGVLGYISESELRRIRRRFNLNNQGEFDILEVSERGTDDSVRNRSD
jgi:hypothetical protein